MCILSSPYTTTKMSCLEACLLLCLASGTLGFLNKPETGNLGISECGKGDLGKFQYTIKNLIQQPTFMHTVILPITGCNDTVLTRYMEKATDENKDTFKNFSTTYFPNFGYYVSAINGVEETFNSTYWELIEHSDGIQKEVGHSMYIPQPDDHIAWNLTVIDFSFQN